MSYLTIIAMIWGGACIALFLAFGSKPFWFNYRGKRIQVRAPLLKLLMIAVLATFGLLSLPFHLACRFVGLRGFWDWREKSYTTQNPFKRAGHR